MAKLTVETKNYHLNIVQASAPVLRVVTNTQVLKISSVGVQGPPGNTGALADEDYTDYPPA